MNRFFVKYDTRQNGFGEKNSRGEIAAAQPQKLHRETTSYVFLFAKKNPVA